MIRTYVDQRFPGSGADCWWVVFYYCQVLESSLERQLMLVNVRPRRTTYTRGGQGTRHVERHSQVSYGGVQLRGPNPYPILGKTGLRKHTLF